MKSFILFFIAFGIASAYEKACDKSKVHKGCVECQAPLSAQLAIYKAQPDVDHDTKFGKLCSIDQEAVKCYYKVWSDECGEQQARAAIRHGCFSDAYKIPDSPDECKQLKALRERGGV
ncbi:hypothetical protein Ddc_22776 [Ditylenchus destructor]|nr:hypothetical protein Ddc_22776 [Ditylenchus destructor]